MRGKFARRKAGGGITGYVRVEEVHKNVLDPFVPESGSSSGNAVDTKRK